MTREELAESIARDIAQHGRAEMPTVDVWEVFAFNQRGTFPFNNAVEGFAKRHGWRCQPSEMPPASGISFYPQEPQPPTHHKDYRNQREQGVTV